MTVLIIAGGTIALLLTSAIALNNTLEEGTEEMTAVHPPSQRASLYPDVTFTTPPNIPLAREYAPYESQYADPAEEYGSLPREYGSPAREYVPPAREYAPYERQYAGPAEKYGPPAREYGSPGREYGPPFRSSYNPYPPSSPQDIHIAAEYPPPTGFGVPPPVAFPPSGGFPPTGGLPPPGAFPPPYGAPPYGVSGNDIKSRLYVLFEPVAVLVVGVTIFVVCRHYVLPYLIYWARSLEDEEELLLEEERSLDNTTTLNILKAVTKGVCLSRISCQLGMMARNYTIKDLALSAIEEEKNPPRLAVIFRDSAMGRVQSCEPYICRRKRLPSSSPAPDAKHWRRKRNSAQLVKK